MTQREDKQRARTSREELGKFFYNLATMTFGTTVLGSGMGLITENGSAQCFCSMLVLGLLLTTFFACLGFVIINKK